MSRFTKVRLLLGLGLALLITIASAEPVVGADKKPYKTDPTKPARVVSPTLPAGQKLTAEQLARHLDGLINAHLKAEKTDASPRSSDEEFLRRVYLDITGKIPTAEAAVRFLDSKESNKRAKLIDELLASKDYGRHQADIWQALLLPRNSDNVRLRQWYPNLTNWMEEKFNANAGWDSIVKDIVTSSGEVDKANPTVYWLANPSADKATDNISRMFLGVQLQCAQCHNHPFTGWKQNEYWGMAAFFLKVGPNGNPRGAAKNGGTVSIAERPGNANRRRLPESAKIVPAKFLQGEQPTIAEKDPARPVFAQWMVDGKNPFFARAMVNRVWYQLFGRGLVNPVDDMHEGNVPSHPELLADLGQQFVANGFDLKYLVRAICNSETYQRSSKFHGNNKDVGPEQFARMAIKPMSPEQLYDSLQMLVGNNQRMAERVKGMNIRGQGNAREQFVTFFSAEDGADPTEYQSGIPQALRLMNSAQMNGAGKLQAVLKDGKDQAEIIEKLYLTILSRRPRAEDVAMVNAYLDRNKQDGRTAYAGVFWALLNSSEFALNR